MGMFGDGLLYASISRNLAEGTGSWWAPFFSSGYWLAEVTQGSYVENPPLMFWMQSVFFRLLGDHWWIEKLYAFILLIINCYLIARVWSLMWRNQNNFSKSFQWLPVWLFYFIPIVVWGSPQNLIDSQLLMFCLLALWCLLKGLTSQKNLLALFGLAVFFIFCGILTKGPVAIYPVCVPALYYIVIERKKVGIGIALAASLFISVIALFILLLVIHEPAREFFTQYWQQRLSVAIEGGRADGLRMGWERLYIFWLLLRENAMVLPITAILFFIAWRKGLVTKSYAYERRVSLFFLLVALCATVPVMASTRQAGMYLIPGLALFAMSAAYLLVPLFMHWFHTLRPTTNRVISIIAATGILLVFVYSAWLIGKPGREKALWADMPKLQAVIPEGEKVAVCADVMSDFVYHVYLQRFHKIELTHAPASARYYISTGKCARDEMAAIELMGYLVVFEGEAMTLHKRYKLQ